MKMKVLILAISFIALAGSPAQDESVVGLRVLPRLSGTKPAAQAYDAYRAGRTTEAVDLAWPLADRNDADALFLLGFIAEEGEARGSKGPSRVQAMELFYRRAAQQGNKQAVVRRALETLASSKEDVRPAARKALEELATDTEPWSYRILGEAWSRGLMNDTPDPARMKELWKKAADLGDSDVLLPLGALLLQENNEEGRTLLEKAASQGIPDAYLTIGMDDENRKKDLDAAQQHYREGAAKENAECMLKLSILLSKQGKEDEGAEWLKKSAAAACPAACAELGKKLARQATPDLTKAYPLLLAAARDGIWPAQYEIAMIHLEGKTGQRDPVAAAAWLTKAMTSGDPESQYQLALLHEKGLAGPVNYSNAGLLYSLASRSGHAEASYRLALMALEGYRVKNLPQAWAYASLGARFGSSSAKHLLPDLEKTLSPAEKQEAEQLYAKLTSESRKGELR